VRFGPDARIRYVSPAVRRYGYEPEALIGAPTGVLTHCEDTPSHDATIQALLRGEKDPTLRREHRFRAADGRWVWLEGNPQIVRSDEGDVVEVINILRDVTRRRELEEAAAAQAGLFEAAFRSAGAGIALMTPDGVICRANPVFCRIIGYDESEALGVRMSGVVHPEDMERTRAQAMALLSGEIDSYEADERYVRRDGAIVWVRATASLVRAADGQPQLIVCQVQDQTERRSTEEALRDRDARLREQAELFENAFHYAVIGKALVGLDGEFLRINEAFCRIVGYPQDELLQLDFQAITHPDDLDADVELQIGRAHV
jgi:PAS domain S-box-containing protein